MSFSGSPSHHLYNDGGRSGSPDKDRPGSVKKIGMVKHFSAHLKASGIGVLLHIGVGTTAKGTLSLLENSEGKGRRLLVKAESNLLGGLGVGMKKNHLHELALANLERSLGSHTSRLRRSIGVLTKGDPTQCSEMLGRSLSLVLLEPPESIDITCMELGDSTRLQEWLDAEWAVAK
ncbi:unnamed protein product [Discosporangium mesarthrocarpum]